MKKKKKKNRQGEKVKRKLSCKRIHTERSSEKH